MLRFLNKNVVGVVLWLSLAMLVIAGAYFARWSTNRMLDTLQWVDHTREVRLQLEQALVKIVDAETSERGFLLSGKKIFLNTFEPSMAAARAAMQNVRQLTIDNPEQQKELDELLPLFEQKAERMRMQMRMRDTEGLAAVAQNVGGLEGKRIMDGVRGAIARMGKREEELLNERSKNAREAAEFTLLAMTTGGGLTIGLLLVAGWSIRRELAARRAAKDTLEAAKAFSDSIVDTVREPLVVLNGAHEVVGANRSFYQAFNRTEVNTAGRSFFDLDHGAWNTPELHFHLENTLTENQQFDHLEVKFAPSPDQSRTLLLNGRKLYRPGNHTNALLLAIEDITARKKVEQMHLQFRALFESLPGLYLILRPDFTVAAVSNEFLRTSHQQRENLIEKNFFDTLPANQSESQIKAVANLRASIDRVLHTGQIDTMAIQRYDIKQPDGPFDERYWSPMNAPIFGMDQKIEYIIHHVEDVTDFVKKRSVPSVKGEEMKARMERMESEIFRNSQQLDDTNQQLRASNHELEAFSYSVSHDLRAPLRHVDGFADLLAKHAGHTLDEKGQRYLQTITKSTKRMGQLIDDLLSFSRMNRTEMRNGQVDLNLLVSSIVAEAQQTASERKIEWIQHPLPNVVGDAALLRQVLVNLINNAVKYSRPRDLAIIEVGCEGEREGELVFYVRDNGVGFDSAYQEKLFGVFQRLHRSEEFEGTGIGLANVRRIIFRHGGRTWAESVLNQGATFYFSLPAPRNGAPLPSPELLPSVTYGDS